MEERNTGLLMDVLKSTDTEDLKQYEQSYLNHTAVTFSSYMDEQISKKHIKRQDIFQRADLPQKYGYKLLSGESHTRDRDRLLRIFFALEFDLTQTQRALALYGMPSLYPKIMRDAVLIVAFNRGISSVDQVNDLLSAHGQPPLSRIPD